MTCICSRPLDGRDPYRCTRCAADGREEVRGGRVVRRWDGRLIYLACASHRLDQFGTPGRAIPDQRNF